MHSGRASNLDYERSRAAGGAVRPLFKYFPSPMYLTLHQCQ
jgi:hypothetical protein